MSKIKTQPCPECGGEMRFEKHSDEVRYQGQTRALKTLGWWCSTCDEAILSGDALREREVAFLELKAEVDGVLGPQKVAEIREKLGLSQRKASQILGGGPRAFQKYEAGKQAVSVPMSLLLRLLANDPRRLKELPGATSKRSPKAAGKVTPSFSSRPVASSPPTRSRRTSREAEEILSERPSHYSRCGPLPEELEDPPTTPRKVLCEFDAAVWAYTVAGVGCTNLRFTGGQKCG
jgi:HTH-type transcriptional regulator/antitoxin MqsA